MTESSVTIISVVTLWLRLRAIMRRHDGDLEDLFDNRRPGVFIQFIHIPLCRCAVTLGRVRQRCMVRSRHQREITHTLTCPPSSKTLNKIQPPTSKLHPKTQTQFCEARERKLPDLPTDLLVPPQAAQPNRMSHSNFSTPNRCKKDQALSSATWREPLSERVL